MSGHLLGWRCNIWFSGFRRLDFSCLLFLLLFFNLDVLIRHVKSGSFTDIKSSHPEHVLHQWTDNPFVLTSVILLISSSNLFKSTFTCHHISTARGHLSPIRSPFTTPPKLQQATSLFLLTLDYLLKWRRQQAACLNTWTLFTKVLTLLSDCSIAGMA